MGSIAPWQIAYQQTARKGELMHRRFLEKWLRDAYAMEKAAIEILEKQVKALNDYPEAQDRVQEHLQETQWQIEQVSKCLGDLNIKPAPAKDVLAKISANVAALTNATAEDRVLKDFISNAAFENMEIASYASLMAAAEECEEPQIRSVCEQILEQEERMAQWCEENIEMLTQEFLTRQEVTA
jgi:ferritin-like metal-binding protein YciE